MNKVQGYADHPNPNPRVVRIPGIYLLTLCEFTLLPIRGLFSVALFATIRTSCLQNLRAVASRTKKLWRRKVP